MSKLALDILAKKILSEVEKTKELRDIQDKKAHKYTLTGEGFYKEVSEQLSDVKQYRNKRVSPTLDDFEKNLKAICEEAAPKIINHLATYNGSKASVEKVDNESVIFYPVELDGSLSSVFNVIRAKKKDAVLAVRDRIVKELFSDFSSTKGYSTFMSKPDEEYLKETKKPSSSYSKRIQALNKAFYGSTNEASGPGTYARYSDTKQNRDAGRVGQIIVNAGFTDVGHGKEDAVAVKRQVLALQRVLEDTGFWETNFTYNQLALTITKDTLGRKIAQLSSKMSKIETKFGVEIEVIPASEESSKKNRSDAAREKKQLNQLGSKLIQKLEKEDWANQEGSNSYMDDLDIIFTNNIINTMLKSKNIRMKGGSKTKRSPSASNSSGKATTDKKSSKTQRNSQSKSKLNSSAFKPSTKSAPKGSTTAATPNWSSLVSIINKKLASRIIANMRFPSLVNRTGTFANSAKVLSVQQTKEGYPSIVYDYERNPYDVFDRVKGVSPWNTPERDPRGLVDKSVREIVQEMAIGRFYTRRA